MSYSPEIKEDNIQVQIESSLLCIANSNDVKIYYKTANNCTAKEQQRDCANLDSITLRTALILGDYGKLQSTIYI